MYKDLETKVKEMEFVLNETEQKSEGDKQHLMDALNKIQSLSEIKDKYEVAIFSNLKGLNYEGLGGKER